MRTALLTVVLFGWPAMAAAQEAQAVEPEAEQAEAAREAEPERPWAEGVSAESQRAALELFRQGNERFAEADYASAASAYREALAHWEHPAIFGNLSVSLIHLDDPVGAYAAVERALAWGEAPFETSTFRQLETNRRLLSDQLATVVVVSDQVGAEVALDGATLFTGPGRASRVVPAGSHRVVATRAGHVTFVRAIDALPGRRVDVDVTLVPLEEAARYERRWKPWMPYVVLASGLAVVGVGAGLQIAARSNLDAFDTEIARECPAGCTEQDIPAAVRDLESRGEAQNRAALVFFVAGGVAAGAGIVLVLLNRPRRVDVDPNGEPIALRPIVGPGAAGLQLSGSF